MKHKTPPLYSVWTVDELAMTATHVSGFVVKAKGPLAHVDASTIPAAEDWLRGLDSYSDIGAGIHSLVKQADGMFRRIRARV